MAEASGRRWRRVVVRRVLPALVAFAIAGAVYAGIPRHAHLRAFSPAALGRLETAMWRDYYNHEYLSLFHGLYRVNRDQYGFSPWDSVQVEPAPVSWTPPI
jgi:hypothetical protein